MSNNSKMVQVTMADKPEVVYDLLYLFDV